MRTRGGGRVRVAVGVVFALAAGVPVRAQVQTTWDGVYTKEQARLGQQLYADRCSSCHGPALSGIDAAPALSGGAFAANWSGVPLSDMVQRIRVSMPADAPGSLGRRQVTDVLAYMLEANGFPAGERALPRRTALLKQIVYQATKPGGGEF